MLCILEAILPICKLWHDFLECASVCPKEVSPDFIARMNRDLMGAVFLARPRAGSSEGG
jgi:hypothetical protein